jgi:inward rectifier potassium channel
MSAPPQHAPPGARRFRQAQGFSFWIVGDRRAVLRDAYHSFLKMRWSLSLGLISIGLLLSNVLFATAFYLTGGVAGSDGSFFDMFSFSMETMATIGYGEMSPLSPAAHTVMIVEAIFGIIVVALATGLVFTKFSRASSRMAFTRLAVITTHDGKNTLMFRCGNMRSNVIIQAQLHVTCSLSRPTTEGRPFYRIIDLPLVRDRMSGLRRGWTVMHVIDEASPIYGLDARALEEGDLEIEISLTGLDDITMQTVHSTHQYTFQDVRFGHRFVDTISPLANGDLVLDLTKFDVIEPDPHVSVAA